MPQFVSEPDELALLSAFRLMKADMKVAMMKVFIGRLATVDRNAASSTTQQIAHSRFAP